VGVRNADAAEPGIHADVHRDCPLPFRGLPFERGADRRIDHRHDVARRGFPEIRLVERAHEHDRLLDA
jgi:hypothetical protein